MENKNQSKQMLEAALFDNDSFSRLKKIIAGCKVISSQLPFANQNDSWILDEDLYKYLFMSSPFSTTSIGLIIQAMISTFQNNKGFLDAIWNAMNYCSKLIETEQDVIQLNIRRSNYPSSQRLENLSIKKLPSSQRLDYIDNKIKKQFALEVRTEYDSVKSFIIQFVEEIFKIFSESETNVDYKIDIFKQFVVNCNSETLILSVLETMQKVRSKYIVNTKFFRHMEEDIEQILIQKKLLQMEIESNLQSANVVKKALQLEDDQKSIYPKIRIHSIKKDSIFSFPNRLSESSKNFQTQKINLDESSYSILDVDHDMNQFNIDTDFIPDIRQIIEKWIIQKHVPQLKADEDPIEYFKNESNFEILMTFVTNPITYPPIDQWGDDYQIYEPFKEVRAFKSSVHKMIKSQGISSDYMIRSYKVVCYITDKNNFNMIKNCNSQIMAKLCITTFHIQVNMIYDFFQNQESQGNLNHIAKLLHFLIQWGPKQSVQYIVDYNLMFSLTQVLFNPFIFKISLDLLNSVFDQYEIGSKVLDLFWLYINDSKLFNFITKQIIKVPSENDLYLSDKNSKSSHTKSIVKQLQEYALLELPKPKTTAIQEKQQLSDLLGKFRSGKCPIGQAKNYLSTGIKGMYSDNLGEGMDSDIKEYITYEELVSKKFDIDNLQQFIRERSSQKQANNHQNLNQLASPKIEQQRQDDQFVFQKVVTPFIRETQNPILAKNQKPLGYVPVVERQKTKESLKPLDMQQDKWINLDQISNQISSPNIPNRENVQNYYSKRSIVPKSKNQNLTLRTNKNQTFQSLPNLSSNNSRESNKSQFQEFCQDMKDKRLVGGFSSSQQNLIYPSTKSLVCTSEIERISKLAEFSEKNILSIEMVSYASAHYVSILLDRFILYENQYDQYNNYQQIYVDTSNIFNSIIDEDMENLQIFIQNYLFKLPLLQKTLPYENSGIESAKIVNCILENVFKISDIYHLKEKIIQCYHKSLDFTCKVIARMHTVTKKNLQQQSEDQTIRLGLNKLLLIDTINSCLELMIKNGNINELQKNPFLILTENAVHILIMWFFDNINHNVYHQKFLRFLGLVFTKGPEQIIVNIIYKLNLLSSLANAYQQVVLNDMPILICNIDSLLFHLKIITHIINESMNNRSIKSLKQIMHTSSSWITLQNLLYRSKISIEPQILQYVRNMFQNHKSSEPQKKALDTPQIEIIADAQDDQSSISSSRNVTRSYALSESKSRTVIRANSRKMIQKQLTKVITLPIPSDLEYQNIPRTSKNQEKRRLINIDLSESLQYKGSRRISSISNMNQILKAKVG